MATSEIMGMVQEALRAMGIGVSGVFAVLAVFYISLKLMMSRAKES